MKDLRNHINQVANQHTELVDNDALWAGIEMKMKKSEKKRRFPPFFFWGASILLVVLSGLGVYTFSGIATSGSEVIDTNNTIAFDKRTSTTPTSDDESELIKSVIPSLTSNKKSGSKSTPIAQDIEIAKNEKTKKSILKNSFTSSAPNNKSISQSNNVGYNISTEILPISKATKKEANFNSRTKKTDVLAIDRSITLSSIAPISNNLNYNRLKITIPAFTIPIAMQIYSDDRSSFSILKSINIYSQYAIGKKTITGSDAITVLRSDSEGLLEQFRFGIESDIIRIFDFTLYGGLSYAVINDKVVSAESFYENKEITYVKTIHRLPNGTEKEVLATDELPHLTTKNSIRYNSHKFISIPVGIRIGKHISKLNLGLGFGMDFNYNLTDTHTVLGEGGKLTDIEVGGKWSSPSLHTAISADYQLSKNWYLHTQLMYRNTTIKNTVQEKYSLYGLNLGVKYEF